MKKIFKNQLWKYFFVIGGLLLGIYIFKFITSPIIKSLIGIGGFFLMFISLRNIKKNT
jgi:hypothetical protein